MATKDGRVQIWYADGSGNVAGYTETIGDIVDTIISAYNEHFGTDIGLWTPETKTLQVGGTVPNWDAYEKIEMPAQKVALKTQSNPAQYTIGSIKNNIYYMLANSDGNGYLVKEDGEVTFNTIGGSNAKAWLINLFKGQGITIDDVVSEIIILNVGSIVPDWSNYTKLG